MAPITLTYTSHPAPSQHINAAVSGLRAQLPLRNLHWKPSTRTSLRTIQEVDVELVELGDVPTGARSGLGSVIEQPLVNLCLVVCEDSETYKNHTKSFIRDWLSLLSSRRSATTPLIVLVNPPTSVAASGKNVFGRDKGILGKLKSDFNTGKRDRCVQVNLPPEGRDDPAAWPEVVNKIKESVVLAFDTAIVEREEEVKRGEAQRLMVGWNFCTWFLLKESLAHSFEAVGLPADALIIYEELEATFFQILKEQNLSWFGKLGATSPRDDSLPVLDTKVKPYREMLQGSAISIFDFRIYVFARQAILLGQLGRITEVAKRGQWFIASLTRRLKESEDDLAEHFIEGWTYTAAMDIVHKCDEWSRIDRPNGDYSGLVAYESARSELLDIARTQVERLGVSAGHLPNEYPFAAATALLDATDDVLFESSETGSQPDQGEVEHFKRAEISNRELVEAKRDPAKFRALYTGLTKKAIMAYDACGKINSVIRLKTDLAALALLMDDWKTAYELCTGLAKSCAEQSVWSPVARYALEGALRSHQALGMSKGSEWAFLVMSYLRVRAVMPVDETPPESDLLPVILDEIVKCKADMTVPDHDAFSVKVRERETTASDSPDVIVTAIEIINKLPVDVPIEELDMSANISVGKPVLLHASDIVLKPGLNTVKMACRSLVQGLCTLDLVSFKLGPVRMTFSTAVTGQQLLMRRPASGLSAILRMPRDISLAADPQVVVEVQSNTIAAEAVSFHLHSDDPLVQYDLSNADGDGQVLEGPTAAYSLGDMKAGTSKQVQVPYFGRPHNDYASARLAVSYTASDGRQSEWSDTFQLFMGSPFAVNVQDFFRPNCLMSQYSITADGPQCFRIDSVTLSPPDEGYRIEGGNKSTEPMIVTPDDPLTRIFKVVPTSKPKVDAEATHAMLIRYINVKEEAQHIVDQVADESLTKALRRKIKRRIQENDWSNQYLTHGWSAVFTPQFRSQLLDAESSQLDALVKNLSEQSALEPPWRTLEILVDVPLRRILTSVDMTWRSTRPGERLYEGRAIALAVRMRSTFIWAGEEDWHEAKLVYDVLANSDDWLVIGKKKGYYDLAAEGGEHETEIVLVPTRSGHLYLPNVVVSLLGGYQQDGPITETHVENAAETLEILPAKGGGVAFIPLEPNWEVDAERRM